jgi:hypothetical protein
MWKIQRFTPIRQFQPQDSKHLRDFPTLPAAVFGSFRDGGDFSAARLMINGLEIQVLISKRSPAGISTPFSPFKGSLARS